MTMLGLLAASFVFGSSVSHGAWKIAAPYAAYLLAAATAVLGFYKFAYERARRLRAGG